MLPWLWFEILGTFFQLQQTCFGSQRPLRSWQTRLPTMTWAAPPSSSATSARRPWLPTRPSNVGLRTGAHLASGAVLFPSLRWLVVDSRSTSPCPPRSERAVPARQPDRSGATRSGFWVRCCPTPDSSKSGSGFGPEPLALVRPPAWRSHPHGPGSEPRDVELLELSRVQGSEKITCDD